MDTVNLTTAVNTMWVLIAGALVFFMQAGFALVEAGFTRSKNTTNILFKNLMDFSIGTITFWIVGYGIMFGAGNGFFGEFEFLSKVDHGSALGIPNLAFFSFSLFSPQQQLRLFPVQWPKEQKFSSYLIYSLIITMFIYPVSGHWIWGGGWLSKLSIPFHDFAGSTVVHSVGGWLALAGAVVLGPRLGKYSKGKVNAIPGHSITLATLGVFILWIGWFGFNPGSTLGFSDPNLVAKIFVTTNAAAAAGAIGTLLITWIKYKKPALSMTLNGVLAGLVAITAGCDVVTPGGAIVIGFLAGILVEFAVEFFDKIAKIDDPVGAISVHGICGAFGTLMVGVFATNGGLLYGGGLGYLGSQAIGVISVAAWTLTIGFALFFAIKYTIGIRVEKKVEENGLDYYEHGEKCYND